MTELFKTFSIRTSDTTNGVGKNCLVESFSIRRYGAKNGYTHNVSSFFNLTYGGYEVDGVILPIMLDKTNIIRIK